MNYREKIDLDMVQAAKSKDKIRLSTVRLIRASLHNKEIDMKRDMNEAEFLQMLSSMVKQRKDSI